MIKGLRTVIYHVDDIKTSKEWYTKILGIEPYFDESFYVGFNVGGFELGLDPDIGNLTRGNNLIAYWGVDNIENSIKFLIENGALVNEGIKDVGGGIKVASLKDPSGNIFGIIENPIFKIENCK